MNRQQKESVVSDFKKMFTESPATFVINYKGLSVNRLQKLRQELRQNGSLLRVTKARLMKIAVQDVEKVCDLQSDFKDQIGVVFTKDDAIAAIKTLTSFSKENKHLDIISGFFESKLVSQEEILTLSKLPSREILLGMLLNAMQGPIVKFVRTLNTPITQLLYVLKQVEEKGNQ